MNYRRSREGKRRSREYRRRSQKETMQETNSKAITVSKAGNEAEVVSARNVQASVSEAEKPLQNLTFTFPSMAEYQTLCHPPGDGSEPSRFSPSWRRQSTFEDTDLEGSPP
ncbi:hypothetical protein MA16_Dca027518 [Dendrobium catenatum]|uniref:Uncharacterized protein n=1 Tax=Dendrobium catenatum TaxID=906689 RepID=A0A2I0VCL3_9ASPA|nr:hypothetical protein MA16_Dca027518 [Dendrobium catenatum]